ncbi:DMT family transporter [Vannielia litorea]|uniref:Permease of the drug/metabolite transporter (DMT) superfamily n=1 Tax=Vannielia litorea TaxID=1217970 RepID=A0A1N6H0U3_9RHOB|nr:DMT family transporter [Vannielia litorea]SIO13431.1 Permease of the drug/metabolite transporter (DMT) superfamily [Vannielia litorea]
MSDVPFAPVRPDNTLAALCIAGATAFIALSTLFAKTLTTDALGSALSPFQVSHGRFVFALVFFVAGCAVIRPRFTRPHWGLHLARTGCGWGGVTLMFAAVAFIPMADATALSFTSPVFTLIFAVVLLGERVGRVRWAAVAVALTGAAVLLRPTPESFQPAALLALGAAVAMGTENIWIKKLTRREGRLQILLVNNVLGVLIASAALLAAGWQSPTLAQWGALAGVGLSMATAQSFYINGMARADASFVAPFIYGTLVFAALFDAVIFGAVPDWVSWLGASIIVAGALLLAWREGRKRPVGLRPARGVVK